MSWRGEEGGIAAAKASHDVVMAPQKPTYLDHSQTELPVEVLPGPSAVTTRASSSRSAATSSIGRGPC